MAEFIGDVVSAATVSPKGNYKQSAIRCTRRPGHRKCPGRIIVCEKNNGDIEWECSSCDYKGTIRGWQGGWSDLSDFRDSSEPPYFELVLTERQYDELKICFKTDIDCDEIIYSATPSKEGIVLRADYIDMKSFANSLIFKLKERGDYKRKILMQILNGVRTVLGHWNSG
jgi:hypothetical protein